MERLQLRLATTIVVLSMTISLSIGQDLGYGPQSIIETEYSTEVDEIEKKASNFIYIEDTFENPFEISNKSEDKQAYVKLYAWLVEKTQL